MCGQALDGNLEIRVVVDERAHLLGQPGQCDLLVSATAFEFLDSTISEVHEPQPLSGQCRREEFGLLALVHAM
jgi:hypothetical protein